MGRAYREEIPSWTDWGTLAFRVIQQWNACYLNSEIPMSGGMQTEAEPWPRENREGLQDVYELPKNCMKKLVWVYMCRQTQIFLKRGSTASIWFTKRTLKPKHDQHSSMQVIFRSHSELNKKKLCCPLKPTVHDFFSILKQQFKPPTVTSTRRSY